MAVTVHMRQLSPYTTQGTARQHTVVIDRPEAKGGTDRGMMGGEMLLAALGGCFMSNLLEIIRTRSSAICDLQIEISGTLDGTPPRFSRIDMQISGSYNDSDEMQKYVTMAERACIVANSIAPAIDLNLSIAAPPVQAS